MIPIANLHLADVMDRHVFSVTLHCTIDSMVERMKAEHVSHVVVLDNAKPIGMLTERDLVRLLHQRVDRSRLVQEFMSSPVATVPGALGFRSAYIQLCLSRLRHLVVLDNDGAVIGVAAERDFLGHLGMELFQNVHSLRDLIDKTVPQLLPTLPVVDAIDLMVKEKRGCIVVAENGTILGIFTESQVPTVLARHEDGSAVTLSEVMRTGIAPITATVSVAEVMAQMVADRMGYVVVVDANDGIIGTIAQSRLLENVRTAVYAEMATRQLVEDQLRQVEAQLEATLEHTPNVAVQWYDREGRVRYWNHASENLYGWTAIEATGRTLDEMILTTGEAAEFKKLLAEIERSGKTLGPMEYQVRNRQGEPRWVEATFFPIPGEGDGELFFVCMDVDISKRRQAEQALHNSEYKYRELAEHLPLAIQVFSPEGITLRVNKAWERMWQVPIAALKNYNVLEDRQLEAIGILELLRQAFAGKSVAFPIHAYDKTQAQEIISGSGKLWLRAFAYPVLAEDGRLLEVVVVQEDISARKQDDDELAQHRQHLEELVAERTADLQENNRQLMQVQFAMDRAGIGIAWKDVETGRFVYANDEACRMLGYTQEEFLQLTVSDINPAYSPADGRQTSLDVLESGLPAHFDTGLRCKDGSSFPVEMTFYAFRDGDILRSIVFFQDISERKQAEDALLRAKEAAEAANRAKSAFLANMSHEIRTPLNGILGLARIGLRENVGRKAREISSKILKSGQHLVGVIDDVLDFSKLEAGKLVITPAPLSLAVVVEEALGLVAERAAEKMLPLARHLAPDLPQWVIGDALRIRQILANLLSNAVKFTEQGEIVLDVRRADAEILFSVHDEGIGMDPQQVADLFQPFQQADDSITRKFGGTGLGLAISMTLARRMDGSIEVASQPGLGSTFTLRLPLPATETQASSASRSTSYESGRHLEGLRVLVAEDIELNREVLEDMLTVEGARCLMAVNGQEAVAYIAEDPSGFDVVLMDIQMPVLDGRAAARQIRVIAPTLPIIALTAHALQEERELSTLAGMVDHISKPIDPAELIRVILAHTGLRTMAEETLVPPHPAVDVVPAAGHFTPPVPKNGFPSVTPTIAAESLPPSLAELDIETGLRFLGGNRARYRNMLDKFVAQHAQDAELIRAALDAGWTDEARRLVHGLKSVAATLGAVPLSETAYALELRLKAALDDPEQPADVDLPLAALTEALAKLINGMKATTT